MTGKVVSGGQIARAFASPSAARFPYIRAAALGGFVELVSAAGGDADSLIERAKIPERALRDPDMVISWTAFGDLMELAAEELGKPALVLEWLRGAPEVLFNLGAVVLVARFTETIRDCCFHSREYWHWHTNASRLTLLEPEPEGSLTLRVSFSKLIPPSRHQVEYVLGSTCALLRALTPRADEGIERVRFRHVRPKDLSLHEAFFPFPVEFGCDHDELIYQRWLHDSSYELKPETLSLWFDRYAQARMFTIVDYDGSARANVEIAIPSLIGTHFCTQPNIAQLLGMGAKTLQRQLAREGVSFAALLDKTRERMARQLLADSDMPVASIAGLLGYAQTPPFTTAVRRWTGLSPRGFRNGARAVPALV